MAKKIFLICFTGMDGTGKTTQAKFLVNSLEASGVRCRYVWNTYRPILTKPFLILGKALFLHGKNAFDDYSQYDNRKKKTLRKGFFAKGYEYLSLIDYIAQCFWTIRLPRMFGQSIVCDRYLYDVVVNLAVELDHGNEKIDRLLKVLSTLIPKPDLVFLLDLAEEVAYKRKTDTPSVEHLKNRRRLYTSIVNGHGFIILDGSKDLEELQQTIQGRVQEVFYEY